MPTYDYRCAKCGNDLEVYQTFSEEPLKKHVGCGGKLTKVLSPVGIVLKGSGFYKNDKSDSGRARSKAREETATTGGSNGSNGSSNGSDSGGSGSGGSESGGSGSGGDSAKPTAASEKSNGAKKGSEQKNGGKKSPVKSA
jgi:putative FmdB family regulatory protein